MPSAASGSMSRSLSRFTPSSASGCPHGFEQIEVVQVVDQQTADQELERQVIDLLALLRPGVAGRLHPAIDDAVADRASAVAMNQSRVVATTGSLPTE